MLGDARWKRYTKPGGLGAVVCGFIAGGIGWYFFNLSGSAFWLCVAAGWYFGAHLHWMDNATDGLWRIEEKLDDIESRLDEIESKPDDHNDRPLEMDY